MKLETVVILKFTVPVSLLFVIFLLRADSRDVGNVALLLRQSGVKTTCNKKHHHAKQLVKIGCGGFIPKFGRNHQQFHNNFKFSNYFKRIKKQVE